MLISGIFGSPLTPITFQQPPGQDPTSLGRLWKSGRSTRLTSAEYGTLVQAQITKQLNEHGQLEVKATHEHMMSTSDGTFAEPGDSGAFLFDRLGQVVGILIGGFKRKETVYFTPIENIFDDIKEVTGAIDVQIVV